MATVHLTANLRRHVTDGSLRADGDTVGRVLEHLFAEHPALRRHVVDEVGRLWSHVTVFVGDSMITDREHLTDPVASDDEVQVMQSLSGG